MSDVDEATYEEWYDRKSVLMEEWLGKQHDIVSHAIIPYAIGGALDLYYYSNGIPGTAIATKELSELPGEGSSNKAFRCYELVMFTKHPLDLDADKGLTEFGRTHDSINDILNQIAPFSTQARLNPHDTLEFPADIPKVGGRCLIFSAYPSLPDDVPAEFGLLAATEIFRSEMSYAREHGATNLFQRLIAKGLFPYSDMDRDSVV